MKSEAEKKKDRFDIVTYILEECILAYPVSSFVISLYKQYGQRGSLSKKQLQGLYAKASEIDGINPGKLATLLALINKMPTRYKSDLPVPEAHATSNEEMEMVEKILQAYPSHKGAVLLKAKIASSGKLLPREQADLARFMSILNSR